MVGHRLVDHRYRRLRVEDVHRVADVLDQRPVAFEFGRPLAPVGDVPGVQRRTVLCGVDVEFDPPVAAGVPRLRADRITGRYRLLELAPESVVVAVRDHRTQVGPDDGVGCHPQQLAGGLVGVGHRPVGVDGDERVVDPFDGRLEPSGPDRRRPVLVREPGRLPHRRAVDVEDDSLKCDQVAVLVDALSLLPDAFCLPVGRPDAVGHLEGLTGVQRRLHRLPQAL
nr:hypothetical protein [Halapricum sp. CBA1109]